MNPFASKVHQALRQAGGLISAAELQTQLGVSQATVSRALAPLLRAGAVAKVGAARSQRYVLLRSVPGVGSSVPIMRVDEQGQVVPFARLLPLVGGAIWVEIAGSSGQRFDGLPWFLDDMRPQGFMGRSFALSHPELGLGQDPRHWSDDDCLRAICLCGEDLPGNLIVGEASLARFHALLAPKAQMVPTYAQMAEQAMQGALPGSSAGGEQPKFCAVTSDGAAVIVKFSPAGASPAGQRWRDLLVCEHIALLTLNQAGIATARTEIVIAAGRIFLQVQRFDRHPPHGRAGLVSLLAFDAEHVGTVDNWAATAERLQARGLLTAGDAHRLCLLEAYGQMIANTDRHYGNVSLLRVAGAWTLAPCYDMLPMLYAPINGELVVRDFGVRPMQPSAATLAVWAQAKSLARLFWQTAAEDARISSEFRAIAAANSAHLVAHLSAI